jgi:4'-phosphopantetheinyl transferase
MEQTEADVPAENDWLSAAESLRMNAMRFAKRRNDWRLGRWTAKRALAVYLDLPNHRQALSDIEIRPAASGAPEVFLANKPAAITISLSHRGGIAACAVGLSGAELGCDLEIVEPRTDAFIADYFAAKEQELIERTCAADRPRLLALLWSAKESALKALRAGLRLDTRSVIVHPGHPSRHGGEVETPEGSSFVFRFDGHNDWRPLHVVCEDGRIFCGWWQNTGDLVRTMVASSPPAPPIFLETPTHTASSAI